MYARIQKRIHEILHVARPGDRLGHAFNIFLVSLIALNIIALVAESVDSLSQKFFWLFRTIEVVSIGIFTVEYVFRLWACTSHAEYAKPVAGRIRYALTPLAIIDLLAVLPFYLPFVGVDLRVMRSVRLMRIFRVAKLARYSDALRTMGRVFVKKKEELITIALVASILLLCASTTMYYVEHDAQPDKFTSIPATMWWGVATLTTVGYGDMYPITPVGKVLGGVIAALGIGLFALPTGILGAAFIEDLSSQKNHPSTICPHCGKSLAADATDNGSSELSDMATVLPSGQPRTSHIDA